MTEIMRKESALPLPHKSCVGKKAKNEIRKMAGKASNYATHKAMTREELGDSTKCVKIISKDKDGEKIKPVVEIDKEKINEDLKYAGYNLMVTSELDMEPLQVYQTYHCLWKIEESFRITKSYLDARPVYVQKKGTIYGNFLIYVRLCDLPVLTLCLPYYLSVSAVLDFLPQFSLLLPGVHDILSDSFSNICSPISPPIPIVYFVPT